MFYDVSISQEDMESLEYEIDSFIQNVAGRDGIECDTSRRSSLVSKIAQIVAMIIDIELKRD